MSLQDVEKDLNITNQALSNLEGGLTNIEDPRAKRTLQMLGKYYGDSFGLAWLEEYLQREGKPEDQKVRLAKLDVVGSVSAGNPIEPVEIKETVWVLNTDIEGVLNARALRIVGDSMRDAGVLDGDIIIVSDTSAPYNRIAVVYIQKKTNLEVTLKRWRQDGGHVRLEPANQDYETKIYPESALTCYGVLIKVIRTYDPPLD